MGSKGDLISRSALKKDLLDRSFFPAIVKSAIEKAHAVDAVEVVRCRDCKYYISSENLTDEYDNPIGADGLCDNSDKYTDADDFCSYGERRAEDGK